MLGIDSMEDRNRLQGKAVDVPIAMQASAGLFREVGFQDRTQHAVETSFRWAVDSAPGNSIAPEHTEIERL